ncbi:MAG TPA: hypothetical protein VGR43_02945 [Dehalococcoidia bacterium]|jgi:hypothetical protein|nr:hypothetical protein [Dehalococcoidia bacterium]
MQIDLSDDERALLRDVLEAANGDLREEIYKTEGTDFKRRLKERELVLQELMRKLGGD